MRVVSAAIVWTVLAVVSKWITTMLNFLPVHFSPHLWRPYNWDTNQNFKITNWNITALNIIPPLITHSCAWQLMYGFNYTTGRYLRPKPSQGSHFIFLMTSFKPKDSNSKLEPIFERPEFICTVPVKELACVNNSIGNRLLNEKKSWSVCVSKLFFELFQRANACG